jgi:hypothetical protein
LETETGRRFTDVATLLADPVSTEALSSLKYPAEIQALAEEIASDSDVPGLESTRLEFLLRAVLYVDRSTRPA